MDPCRKAYTCNVVFLFVTLHLITTARSNSIADQELTIEYIHVESNVKLRLSTTHVTGKLTNRSPSLQRVQYQIVVPENTFVSEFYLEMDGKIYSSNVRKRDINEGHSKPEEKEEPIIHRIRQKLDVLTLTVLIPAYKTMVMTFAYQALMKRQLGYYVHFTSIHVSHPVDVYKVRVDIEETRPISTLAVNNATDSESMTSIKFNGSNHAIVTLNTSSPESKLPALTIQYDVQRDYDLGDIIISGHYFVHYFAPIVHTAFPKDILFILDKSGSMSGDRIQHLRFAMNHILDHLKPTDRFCILAFESGVEWMDYSLLDASPLHISRAKDFVVNMSAGGGTNIKKALLEGLMFLNNADDDGTLRSKIIIFLTDGAVLKMKRDTLQLIKALNSYNIPIFSIALGKDADFDFVNKLSLQNNGEAKDIKDGDEARKKIFDLFNDISVTLLKNISFEYQSLSGSILSKSVFHSYFNGTELLTSGYFEKKKQESEFNITYDFLENGNKSKSNIKLPRIFRNHNTCGEYETCLSFPLEDILERIWIHKMIVELFDRINTGLLNDTGNQVLAYKALLASLKYGYVTPVTELSMPVFNGIPLADFKDTNTYVLPEVYPTRNRTEPENLIKFGVGGDPHFYLFYPGITFPFCFEANATNEIIIQLLKVNDIVINVATVRSNILNKKGKYKLYVGEVYMSTPEIHILLTATQLVIGGTEIEWNNISHKQLKDILITQTYCRIKVNGNDILIMRRLKRDGYPIDFLDIEFREVSLNYSRISGYLGQFYKWQIKQVSTIEKNTITGKFVSVQQKGRIYFRAHMRRRHNNISHTKMLCWQFHKSLESKLHFSVNKYLIPTIFHS